MLFNFTVVKLFMKNKNVNYFIFTVTFVINISSDSI